MTASYGHFELGPLLGEGGMGAVYHARHLTLGTPAVIKLLLPAMTRRPDIVQRFINEARAAARLKHRNIVQVLDCGQAPSGEWYIALEYLDGAPLSKVIQRNQGPFFAGEIVHVLSQACNGLHVAHAHGIVHRDIKPDNLFLTQEGGNLRHVTILDFGIAKLGEGDGGVETRTGNVMGTPLYMAPEQLMNSKAVDPRSDVWALGVIAFEMATGGFLPFGVDFTSPIDLHNRQIAGAPDPRRAFAGISEQLALVIMRALAPDPRRRWQSTQEFALALAEAHHPGVPGEPSGVEIVEKYASELRQVTSDAATVGNRVPGSLPNTPSSLPGPRTAPLGLTTRPPVLSGHTGPQTPASWQGPAVGPVATINTLSGAAAQSVAPLPAVAHKRRWPLAVAIGGLLTAGAAIVAASTGGEHQTPAAAPPRDATVAVSAPGAAPSMTAVAIVTEPAGATVLVNDTPRGVSPMNFAAPAGAELQLRVELDGYEPQSRTVKVSDEPAMLRLTLRALAVDAGSPAPLPTTAPAPATKPAKRRATKAPAKDSDTDSINLHDVMGE